MGHCCADCCDGSDESSGKCSNTCAQAGAAARAALRARAATEAAGARVKEGYVRQAQADKQKWQAEEQKLSQQVLQQKKLVEEWRGESAAPAACQDVGDRMSQQCCPCTYRVSTVTCSTVRPSFVPYIEGRNNEVAGCCGRPYWRRV